MHNSMRRPSFQLSSSLNSSIKSTPAASNETIAIGSSAIEPQPYDFNQSYNSQRVGFNNTQHFDPYNPQQQIMNGSQQCSNPYNYYPAPNQNYPLMNNPNINPFQYQYNGNMHQQFNGPQMNNFINTDPSYNLQNNYSMQLPQQMFVQKPLKPKNPKQTQVKTELFDPLNPYARNPKPKSQNKIPNQAIIPNQAQINSNKYLSLPNGQIIYYSQQQQFIPQYSSHQSPAHYSNRGPLFQNKSLDNPSKLKTIKVAKIKEPKEIKKDKPPKPARKKAKLKVELMCICLKEYDPDQFCIQCDNCDLWYHGS